MGYILVSTILMGLGVIRKDSWNNREVGKFQPFEMKLQRMKLETSSRSWKSQSKLESDHCNGKVLNQIGKVH